MLTAAGAPEATVSRLNAEVDRILGRDDIKERLLALGMDPVGGSPREFAELIRKDISRWAGAIRASGAKRD